MNRPAIFPHRLTRLGFVESVCRSRRLRQSVEESLDKINRLPAAERQQKLSDGARKEGELVWYSTMNRENSQELISLFEKDHPYVKVKLLNGSAVQTMTRITSEYSAKSYLFDITHIRGLFLVPLRKRQIIAAYRSPFRDGFARAYKDNEGYFNAIFTQGQFFLANKNLLKPQDYPRSIEDLLAPRWKGQLGMDDESYDWIAALMDYYGEEKGKQIADRLGRQQLNLRKGNTLLGQLVAAGEIPLMVDGYNHTGYLLKSKRRADRIDFSRTLRHRENPDRRMDQRPRAPSPQLPRCSSISCFPNAARK